MISITLPDGNIKAFEPAVSGRDVALSISEGLARNSVAMELDGRLVDLDTPIRQDAKVRIVTTRDPEALEVMRHSAAHVMAQAILRLYPEAKLTIGPVVEDGFYYDIDMPPVSEEDFPRIEAEIQKIVKAKLPIRRREVTKAEALEAYRHEPYKLEMIQDLQDGTISLYEQGEFTDLCRGPHVPHTGFVKAIKLLKVSGAYWRADPARAQLQRIYGTAYFDKKELDAYLTFLEEAKRRNHRKIGQALDLFSFHDEAPGHGLLPPQGHGHLERAARLLAHGAPRGRLRRDQDPDHPQPRALGALGALGQLPREHVHHHDRRDGVCHQAHELPGRHAPLQPQAALLPGPAAAGGRDRSGAPPRALRGALGAVPGARLPPGRRPHLHDPRSDRAGDPGGAAPGRAHLRHLRARLPPRALHAAQEIDRHRRAVGTRDQRPEIRPRARTAGTTS